MKQADLFLLFEKKNHLVQFFEENIFFFFFFSRYFVFFLKSSMDSFLEYILDSIYVFKVVDFNFLVCTGWSGFCCVNNGTCNCVWRFDRFAPASYLNGIIFFDIWSKRSNSILLEWKSDNRVTYIYVSIGMDI